MINKQSLWFLTLFSLILVLSVYYITMPNDLLLKNNSKYSDTKKTSGEVDDSKVTLKESELLVSMRINLESERDQEVANLKTTLTNEEATSEEKNDAYEQIKYLSNLTAQEQQLEQKIKKEFGIENFVKINNNEIKIVAVKQEHDVSLANSIMKSIQAEFPNKMSIIVQFEK